MSLQLTGTVKNISETQTFASGFQKAEMVLLTEEQYPQPINIEFLQDKIHILDNVKEGDHVTISINIRGKEWVSPQNETRYFNSIVGWRIENKTEHHPTQAVSTEDDLSKREARTKAFIDSLDDDDDGLDF